MIWLIVVGYLIAGIITASLIVRFDDLNDDSILLFFFVIVWPLFAALAILSVIGYIIATLVRLAAGKHADR